ncbi:hypothetical protein PSACC_02191 [Paramicrosporidium saccamoebae]|uniref:Uncharacterized protein n=1 Tax=Paramicrosporidium saccamoebae TaxID=1246581 RepID=A0A2H9TJH2_9FUNG|nr:hypothetical protein PSACC_02191 [Paramicrosporidium saccamoebae]
MHINMPVTHGFYDWYRFIPLCVAYAMLHLISEVYDAGKQVPELIVEVRVVHALLFIVILHSILLAILKYRAAHHRKLRRWQQLNNNTKEDSNLKIYLKELLLCEAKMAPVSHPFFSEIWHILCSITAWMLFPRPIVAAYVFNSVNHSMFAHLLLTGYQGGFVRKADSFVYNGQRYRHALEGTSYSGFKDEDQNILYYPTNNLYGLIPFDNRKVVDQ